MIRELNCNYCGELFTSFQGRKSCCESHRELYKKQQDKIYRSKPENIEKARQRHLRHYKANFVPATRGRKPKNPKQLFKKTAHLAKNHYWPSQIQNMSAEKIAKLDFSKIEIVGLK